MGHRITLGEMFPDVFKEVRERMARREKAIQIELAWSNYRRLQGVRQRGTLIKRILQTEKGLA